MNEEPSARTSVEVYEGVRSEANNLDLQFLRDVNRPERNCNRDLNNEMSRQQQRDGAAMMRAELNQGMRCRASVVHCSSRCTIGEPFFS